MMCLVTVRQIKPGTFDDFRAAWQPDPWLPQLQRVEILRNDENPDEVTTIGYVDTAMTDDTVATISAVTGRSPEQTRQALERRQPIGRLVTPDEVADAVLLCVASAAITGQGINVDGGAVQS